MSFRAGSGQLATPMDRPRPASCHTRCPSTRRCTDGRSRAALGPLPRSPPTAPCRPRPPASRASRPFVDRQRWLRPPTFPASPPARAACPRPSAPAWTRQHSACSPIMGPGAPLGATHSPWVRSTSWRRSGPLSSDGRSHYTHVRPTLSWPRTPRAAAEPRTVMCRPLARRRPREKGGGGRGGKGGPRGSRSALPVTVHSQAGDLPGLGLGW